MHSRSAQCLRLLAVWIVLLGGVAGAHAQLAFQVKDINTTRPRALDFPLMSDPATLGTTALLVLDDGGTGAELWKIDGITGSAELLKDICPGRCSSSPFSLLAVGGSVFFRANDGIHGIELWKSDGTTGGTVMVRDIYPGAGYSSYGLLTSVDGVLYFAADDGIHGAELWTSDGTSSGTMLVADLNPGPAHSYPYIQASSQGRFLFTASDDSHGQEPWISDGTAAGTHRIRDLNPGTAPSIPFPFPLGGDETALGLPDGTFLFRADDGTHGQELWRTDGTDAGTVLVKDIYSGADASEPAGFTLLNGKVYFQAGAPETGKELWSTDGTGAGTALVKDIAPGTPGSYPERLTLVNGRLFFRAVFELWTSDGTAEGTVFLASGSLLAIANLGGSALALVAHPFSGNTLRLFKTDGTPAGTVEVKNLGPQDNDCVSSRPDPKEVNGALFFYHCKPGSGLEIWKTDSTAAGTVLVQSPTQTPSFPSLFSATGLFLETFGSGLFFSADDGVSGGQLWHTDGSAASTQPVPGTPSAGNSWPDLRLSRPVELGSALVYASSAGLLRLDGSGAGAVPLGASVPSPESFSPSRAGNLLFFRGHSPATGFELWKTDATAAGTGFVKDITPGPASTDFQILGSLGSEIFFKTSGDELWKSDGTEAGTVLLRDFQTGSGVTLYHHYRTVLGNTLFFISLDDTPYWGLWKTDGTVAGTVRVKSFDEVPPGFIGSFTELLPWGDRIFLKFDDVTHGQELWVSDGTEAGTHLLKDVRPGAESSGADWRILAGQSLLYFVADDGAHGREQWVTDGTTAGTRLVMDIRPGAESSNLQWPFFFPGFPGDPSLPYFSADDGTHGQELWVTDGTEAGTRMIKDVQPGPGSSDPNLFLANVQDHFFFFSADDGAHGRELWVTDGTGNGTRLVKDVLPGPESSQPSGFTLGRTFVFTASDGVHGAEPWVTSGTETGTFMLQDLTPGASSSEPVLYTSAPPYVYFLADDGTSGTELWKTRKAALEPTFDDVHSTYWAWPYVEALVTAGLTTGCGGGLYCPTRPVTRAEMAVFILRIVHGNTYVPPDVTVSRFADVPASHWALDWIEELAVENITSGCGTSPPLYCPESDTARDQMAVFLLRALHGASYTPPPATGTRFTDVPAGYWAAGWIEQLAAEGITSGCAANLYCPGEPVSRDQMAVFLTRALDLPLP